MGGVGCQWGVVLAQWGAGRVLQGTWHIVQGTGVHGIEYRVQGTVHGCIGPMGGTGEAKLARGARM